MNCVQCGTPMVHDDTRFLCPKCGYMGPSVSPSASQFWTMTTDERPGRYEFHNGEWRFTPEDETE